MDYWTKKAPKSVLSGKEHFSFRGKELPITLYGFWQWYMSDLFNNTMRGGLAEFIVAKALNIPTNTFRQDWGPYDLLYHGQYRIEVKCSGYLQTWNGGELSKISFNISPARAWTDQQKYDDNYIRHSDAYVFCIFAGTKKECDDPINLTLWEFFVVKTSTINKLDEHKAKPQKTISLNALKKIEHVHTDYNGLHDAIEKTLYI